MLDGNMLDEETGEITGSGLFPHYMRLFEQLQPDAVFLTARSAIPVADSIRGYCDKRGIGTPPLYYIKSNMDLSHAVFSKNDYHCEDHEEQIRAEVRRIRLHAYFVKTAVIVDQYVHKGHTLRLARRMLRQAGITPLASTGEARWYEQAHLSLVDVEHMTSDASEIMYEIGQYAASCSSSDMSDTVNPRAVERYRQLKSL
jgi:hypothetical protein